MAMAMSTAMSIGPSLPSFSSQSGSGSDNALTQLPRVDFNFEDLRARMGAFTARFDAFIETGRKRVLEERNAFRGRLGELSEDRRLTQSRIVTLSSTLTSHAQLLARESAEKAEIQAAVHTLSSSHQERAAACARLRTQIQTTQRQIDAKRAAQAAYGEKIEAQSRLNGPELGFWEEYLGTRIEGSGREDVVRVIFVFEGPRDGGGVGEREGVFELKVPDRGGYEVVFARPRLEEKRMLACVERLNESRDIGAFLKGMRGLFGEILR